MEGNVIGQFQWINGYEDKHSNPVYKHAINPDKWEVSADRFHVTYYGEGSAIDIKILDSKNDFAHHLNITVDEDGKLKAVASEQTK